MVVLQQMVIFFILMGVGFAARKAGIMSADFLPKLSALIANVAGPCLIMSGAIGAGERMPLDQAGFALAVFAGLIAAMIAIGWVLPALLRFPASERPAINFAFWMTNIGYLGLPFVASVYEPSAQIYVVLYLIPNNLLLYTYAIWLMRSNERAARRAAAAGGATSAVGNPTAFPGDAASSTRGASTLEEDPAPATGNAAPTKGGFASELRKLINPGVIAALVTVALYFGGIDLPHVVGAPIEMLGSATAPLSMMLVGAQLVDERLMDMLRDVRLIAFTILKMLVLPIAILLVLRVFIADVNLLGACLAIVAMPSGVLVSAFSLLYDPAGASRATQVVAFTTFVAVATIPLVALAVGL